MSISLLRDFFVKYSFVILLFSLVLSLTGCSVPASRNFSDADLLIDVSVLPENWALVERITSIDEEEGQISGAYITFYATNTSLFVRSGEHIYRYSSDRKASWHYKRMRSLFQGKPARGTEWQTPESFNFSSRFADQWHFVCSRSFVIFGPEFGKEDTVCIYLAQYEEFVIRYVVPLQVDEQPFFSPEQAEGIISEVDRKVTIYLQDE